MTKVVITRPGNLVVDEFTALTRQPVTPSTAAPADIGLVEISQSRATELIPGPPGAKGDTGPVGPVGPQGTTDWNDLTNKPPTFPPTVPIDWNNIANEPATFPPTLPVPWSGLSGVPATFPPSAHGHAFTEISGTITAAQHGNLSGSALHAIATSANAGFMVDAVNDGTQYVRKNGSWSPVTVPPGTVISDNPPGSPSHGQEWWQSSTGNMFIFYVDPGGGAGQWVQTNAAAQAVVDDAGKIDWFARQTPPVGWLKANGALVSRTDYSRLFTAIGTAFGVGDGSTTFGLPDLRGEFVRGFDDGRGVDAARVFGSAQADTYLNHQHTSPAHDHGLSTATTYASGSATIDNAATGTTKQRSGTWTRLSELVAVVIAMSTTGGTETRPRNIALLACVRY